MSISQTDIEKIAHLARLAIVDQDKAQYCSDLEKVLSLVEQMQQVNTDNIEPLAHPMDASQRLRADEITESNSRHSDRIHKPDRGGHGITPDHFRTERTRRRIITRARLTFIICSIDDGSRCTRQTVTRISPANGCQR